MEGSGAREWLQDPTAVLGKKGGNKTHAPRELQGSGSGLFQSPAGPRGVGETMSGVSAECRFRVLSMEAGTKEQKGRRTERWEKPKAPDPRRGR